MDIQLIIGISSFITSIGTLAAVIVAIKMFSVAKKSFLKDHERRKKQSTIELYNEISNNSSGPLRLAISDALKESHTEITYKPILPDDPIWTNNPELRIKLMKYCRNMERLAVGIRIGVYDYKTFCSIAGNSTADLFLQIRRLLDKMGPVNNYRNDFCIEYRKLCNDLVKKLYIDEETKDDNTLINLMS